MVSKWNRGEGIERFHVNTLLQGMLYELFQEYERSQGSPVPDMVDVVATYIAGHYRQELELKGLAALGGCSVRQLQRRFKQLKLLAPMEYVIQLRMESAARMLRHTESPIGEVAERTGYRDTYYFSRAFKKYYGVPPQIYRRNTVSNPDASSVYTLLQNRFASSYQSSQGMVICHMRGRYGGTTAPLCIAVLDIQYADHLLAKQ
ncbi:MULTISPECIES: helix-turn-helix domain-containing protein [Paenibacillus]|uniref:helix-turn-helix domain-containing protein n=1 Tax=Paenibacillus TaxID=44249 RepID=UPI001EECA5A6|nr:helix-turn-helix transcriptional regulator [Paenibacillus sp. EKM211P]MEE4562228.1 helix-turn-helix transcriptional regulator [Paenibacillus polymyxa]